MERVIAHEDYLPYLPSSLQYYHNDIALIRLKKVIQFNEYLKPVCLPFSNFNERERDAMTEVQVPPSQLVLAGWGRTLNSSDVAAKRASVLPVWPEARCLEDEKRNRNQICAGKKNKGSCGGDSGGPLMHRRRISKQDKRMVIEGIVSYGVGVCANQFWPSVFTRVRSFEKWIDDNMIM